MCVIWKNRSVLVGFHTARQKRVCLFRVIPPQRSGSKSCPSARHCLSPGPSEGHAGIYRLSAGGSIGKLGRCASVHFITFFISYLLYSLCSDRSNDAREHKHLLKSTWNQSLPYLLWRVYIVHSSQHHWGSIALSKHASLWNLLFC